MKTFALALVLLSAALSFAQSDTRTIGTITATSTDCSVAGSCVTVPITNYSQVAVSVNGTYAGVTINFEFSDDGGLTWYTDTCSRTDANLLETSEVLPSNQSRAWDCGVSASTNFRVRASAYSSGTMNIGMTRTAVQIEPAATVGLSINGSGGGANPCVNPHTTLSTAFVAMSGTTLTQFIAAVAGQKVYVCSAVVSNSTATNPVALKFGTGSNCGTGTGIAVDLFTAPAAAAAPVVMNGPILFSTAASQALCYLQTGTTPTATLVVNYIQQ